MTSTSSEAARPVVLRDVPVGTVSAADAGVDLRHGGAWTRFGSAAVRGDTVTEATLSGIAERSRDAARAQGFAAGWAEGRRVARDQVADAERQHSERLEAHLRAQVAHQQSVTAALEAAVARCTETARATAEQISGQAVELALQIAEAVLGRELAVAADPGADALRRALVAVEPEVAVVVRMHPADRDALDPAVLAGRPSSVVADPAVRRGDAVVETESTVVDATLTAALARVREVLGA